MRRLAVLTCLLLTNLCHAAAVTSNGSGGGLWSAPATWADRIVPQSADSVVIAAGDTVVFDVDMSGWPNGVARVQIEGVLQACTEAGRHYLKTSGDVVLGVGGQLNAGAADAPYPLGCVFTIDLDGKPNSIEVGSGATVNFYCARPAAPIITLSEAATAGQTELRIDTDVVGDIWSEGDTIRIDDIDKGLNSEKRVIATGGIAADRIYLTEGLANAKTRGARVILVSRNVRIVGSTDYAVRQMDGGILDCEISACTVGVYNVTNCTIAGTVSGCTSGINAASNSTICGVVSGCAYGIISSAACAVTGEVSGCTHGVAYGAGNTISGTISGCIYGVIYGFDNTVSGMVNGCGNGFYTGTGTLEAATFSGNRFDLRRVISLFANNTSFSGTTENFEFNTSNVPSRSYVASYDHDAVPGAFKAWTRGGVVLSDVDTVPKGYEVSYRHLCENAAMPCFRQDGFTVGSNQTLWVEGKIKITEDHSVWAPRLEVIDAGADPLVDARYTALASNAVAVPDGRVFDWQDVAVSYTNTGLLGKRVLVRCSAQRATGNVYEVWSTWLE